MSRLLTGGAACSRLPERRAYFISEIARVGMAVGFFDWQPFLRKYSPVLIETCLTIVQRPSTTSFGFKTSSASAPRDKTTSPGLIKRIRPSGVVRRHVRSTDEKR
jgi:hypothetical protein